METAETGTQLETVVAVLSDERSSDLEDLRMDAVVDSRSSERSVVNAEFSGWLGGTVDVTVKDFEWDSFYEVNLDSTGELTWQSEDSTLSFSLTYFEQELRAQFSMMDVYRRDYYHAVMFYFLDNYRFLSGPFDDYVQRRGSLHVRAHDDDVVLAWGLTQNSVSVVTEEAMQRWMSDVLDFAHDVQKWGLSWEDYWYSQIAPVGTEFNIMASYDYKFDLRRQLDHGGESGLEISFLSFYTPGGLQTK